MRIRLSLAAIACLLSAQAVAQPPKAASRELNAILSMTEDQAIAIATSMAAGTTEPIAINDVNRVARAEVCRHYIGSAVVEIEKTENHQGNLFMLAGFRPIEGGALADWVAPSTALPFRVELRTSRSPSDKLAHAASRRPNSLLRRVLSPLPKAAARCKPALNFSKTTR